MQQQHSPTHTKSDITSQPLTDLTLWQRFRQFQPSSLLVKLLFAWWLLLVLASALQMTKGFGVASLMMVAQPIQWLCIVALLLLAVIVVLDLLSLIALSQAKNFRLYRQYPSNVPIYHELNIEVFLTFLPENIQGFSGAVFNSLQAMGIGSVIHLQFYDDYPNQVTTIQPDNPDNKLQTSSNTNIHANKDTMPIAVTLDVASAKSIAKKPRKTQSSKEDNYTLNIHYPVLPIERGTGYFGVAHIRLYSPFRLFRRQFSITETTAETQEELKQNIANQQNRYLRVLADFSGLLSNQLSAVFEKSPQAGIQALMQQGHGSDFLKLREYTAGDAIRQIDWKASSRHRRLMSKSYEDDNDQNVVFLLDCGEQMRHKSDDGASATLQNKLTKANDELSTNKQQLIHQLSYFDQVLNAVLLLAYVANKQGDAVGLMTFGGVDNYLPPKKGVSLIRNLLNNTADIKPTMQTSDYYTASQNLMRQLTKRTLVVMITNTRAEASDELLQAMQLLSQNHQVVFANLTEQAVYERLHGEMIPEDLDEALLYHALTSYEQGRQQLHQYLSQKTGALCLHTTANKLPMKLTQAYLSLRR